jgi:hypothetical protein
LNVPLPPKLTSLPPELVGVFPFAFHVASAFVTKLCMKKKPLALGTRARNEEIDDGFLVIAFVATLTQTAFVSPALVADSTITP